MNSNQTWTLHYPLPDVLNVRDSNGNNLFAVTGPAIPAVVEAVNARNSRAAHLQALEDAARAFDSIVRALHFGQTVSISSVQNCAAKVRAALAN